MPVQEQTPYIKYVANGVTQTFATEFDCESKDQLVVMLNGEEPAFASWSYADKQVTFLIAPVADTVVELKRQSKLKRTTDYQSFNHTLNYKALNSDFDRIWYAIQEQNYKAGQYDYDYNFVLTQVRPISTGGTGADNATSARNNLNVYSKGQVDALVATGGQGSVVSIDGGGTGADNAEEARANLDVYSQAEVDFKIDEATPNATETIAGKAKIATTAIAQAGVNDTDIITALKLKQSFTSLHGDTGWERLPDGLIIQWGLAAVGVTTPFPIAFPTACYRVAVSHSVSTSGTMIIAYQAITATRTGVTMSSIGGVPNSYIAIGR